jgi:hypothetical protein
VDGSLAIVALNFLVERKNAFVPDVWVDVKPFRTVEKKGDEMMRQHIVAGKS